MNKNLKQQPQSGLDYSALHWFALYTKSRHEKKVKELLDSRNYETFLPLVKEHHKWSDRKKVIEVPLIKGYIFIRIAAKNAIYVTRIPGATRFIKFNNEPAPIPDFQIEALMRATASDIPLKKAAYLESGQDVQVCDGPMKGAIGKLVRIENENRFFITLRIPPCAFEVMINPELLEPHEEKKTEDDTVEDKKITRVKIPLGM